MSAMPAPLPPHAYVPGRTERHPEGYFDAVRDTVQPGMGPADLTRSAAFQTGLHYLEEGYYWEAHEVFEPVWMALPADSAERRVVQALIQLANAHLKQGMGRPKAALRLCAIVHELVAPCAGARLMGIDVAELFRQVTLLERALHKT